MSEKEEYEFWLFEFQKLTSTLSALDAATAVIESAARQARRIASLDLEVTRAVRAHADAIGGTRDAVRARWTFAHNKVVELR